MPMGACSRMGNKVASGALFTFAIYSPLGKREYALRAVASRGKFEVVLRIQERSALVNKRAFHRTNVRVQLKLLLNECIGLFTPAEISASLAADHMRRNRE